MKNNTYILHYLHYFMTVIDDLLAIIDGSGVYTKLWALLQYNINENALHRQKIFQ